MNLEGSCHCGRVRFRCQAYAPVPFLHCYCSICRKTAGGGGFAINLGARALEVEGREFVGVYQARIRGNDGECSVSSGRRHFCKECGSALWMFDPQWPDLVHPHASAIDTPLPAAPERVHMMLGSKANWVPVPDGQHDVHQDGYPDESLEDWHRRHGLLEDSGGSS